MTAAIEVGDRQAGLPEDDLYSLENVVARLRFALHGAGVVDLTRLAWMDHFESLAHRGPPDPFVEGFDILFPYAKRLLLLCHEAAGIFVVTERRDLLLVSVRDASDLPVFDAFCAVLIDEWRRRPTWQTIYDLSTEDVAGALRAGAPGLGLPMWTLPA